jgi:hypothetical protein
MVEVATWGDVENVLLAQPAGAIMRIPKFWFPHPTYHGLAQVFGFPEGQIADFQKPLGYTGRLFVREFHQWYDVHREDFHPWRMVNPPVGPASTGAFVTGSAALGAVLGAAVGESDKSAVTGAVLGGLLAALVLNSR